MNRTCRHCFLIAVICLTAGCSQSSSSAPAGETTPDEGAATTTVEFPKRLNLPHLPNAIRVNDNLISGGLPEGEEGFAELKRLGVKTVISVDGARPDVATAETFGLRYVHLPHGYDGIPPARAQELSKAVRDLPGVIYIHCHHGKHRSPAAAAVACRGLGLLDQAEAMAFLKVAGTSENYRGLYRSAAEAAPLEPESLDSLQVEFRSAVEVPPLVEAMADLERTYDHLRKFSANGWQPLRTHPDLDAAHEALLLREHFTEMQRLPDVRRRPEKFQKLMKDSEAAAQELENGLRDWIKAGRPKDVPEAIGNSLERVNAGCVNCHVDYRL